MHVPIIAKILKIIGSLEGESLRVFFSAQKPKLS